MDEEMKDKVYRFIFDAGFVLLILITIQLVGTLIALICEGVFKM
jgi:hypothetical protein